MTDAASELRCAKHRAEVVVRACARCGTFMCSRCVGRVEPGRQTGLCVACAALVNRKPINPWFDALAVRALIETPIDVALVMALHVAASAGSGSNPVFVRGLALLTILGMGCGIYVFLSVVRAERNPRTVTRLQDVLDGSIIMLGAGSAFVESHRLWVGGAGVAWLGAHLCLAVLSARLLETREAATYFKR